MTVLRPSQLPPGSSANPTGSIPIDQGSTVEKVTPKQVVDAGRPLATQVAAETGASNDDLMSSLRVSQAIDAQAATIEAVNARVPYTELASTAPGEGAAFVGMKQPYTDTISRNVGGKFKDLVSVTDFDSVASSATSAFTKAFAAAAEYGRDLYIPKLDAGAKYKIQGDILVPIGMKISGGGSGSGSHRSDAPCILEFEDGAFLATDASGLTLENFQVQRIGVTPGPAMDFAGDVAGVARNVMNNVSIIGSTGVGARFSGGWLFSWFNPYVRECDIGILIEEGSFVTGMNSMSLFGGEIQANTTAGIVLDVCKQFNLVGTAVEGNGIGLGLGRNAASVNILGYFEANSGGHIMPYSHEGGNAGTAQAMVVQGASYFLRGSGATRSPDLSIDIPRCRQFVMEDGVFVQGYAGATSPVIHVQDVGDSNRAAGMIGQISIDAPSEFVLDNDCQVFGRETRRNFYLNVALPDAELSPRYTAPIWKGPGTRRNPSTIATVILHVTATGAGSFTSSTRRFDSAGVQIGSNTNNTTALSVGYNRVAVTISDSENLAYLDVLSFNTNTATGVTLLEIEVSTYENTVKNI